MFQSRKMTLAPLSAAAAAFHRFCRCCCYCLSLLLLSLLLINQTSTCQASLRDIIQYSDSYVGSAGTEGTAHILHSIQANRFQVADEIRRIAEGYDLTPRGRLAYLDSFSSGKQGAKPPPSPGSRQPSLLATLGNIVQSSLAPLAHYVQLIGRFKKWFGEHRDLEERGTNQRGGAELKPALNVLKEEYAKADELLRQQKCISESGQPTDTESMDFVFQVLQKLIDRLERRLEKERRQNQLKPTQRENGDESATELETITGYVANTDNNDDNDGNDDGEGDLDDDDERVRVAMHRVKITALKGISVRLVKETMCLARIALFNKLAKALVGNYYPKSDLMEYLSSIVSLVGDADSSLAVGYLRDLKFRAALAAVNQLNFRKISDCYRSSK